MTTAAAGTLRLNIGCGFWPLPGWINIDESVESVAQGKWRTHVPPLPFDRDSVTEIYAGHFIEHLTRIEAAEFLDEAYRVLLPGGRLGLMVPDMREILRRYVMDEPAPIEYPPGHFRDLRDLDELYEAVIYSTMQVSQHRWGYDQLTLSRALTGAGFQVLGEFDRWHDPRVAVGAWYQFGLDAVKP